MLYRRFENHTVDGRLTAQLFQHLGGTGESISRLADGDVQHELLDAKLPHGVRALIVFTLYFVRSIRFLNCDRRDYLCLSLHTMASVMGLSEGS